MRYKILLKSIYYYCLMIWSFVFMITGCTRIEKIWRFDVGTIGNLTWYLVFLILVALTLYLRKGKSKIIAILLIALGIWTGYNSGYMGFMLPAICFVTAGKDIDVDKAVHYMYRAQLASFYIITILALTGVIENYSVIRVGTGIVRYALGYYHPNTLATVVLQIGLMHWYLHRNKEKWGHLLIYAVNLAFVYYVTNSMTASMLLLLQICLALYTLLVRKQKLNEKMIKRVRWILALPLLGSILLSVFWNDSIGGSSNLAFRFYNNQQYWEKFPLTLGGQRLDITYSLTGRLYTLDNSYLFLILGFGILVSIVFFYEYTKTIRFQVQDRNLITIFVILIFAIHGISETSLVRFGLNFSMILWTQVFGTRWRELFRKVSNKETRRGPY